LHCRKLPSDVLQAGKTSLVKALVSASSSTKHINLRDRSAALDISTQKLPLPGNNGDASDTIQCRLWDFGGHEVFYLSHTMHFTGRCLYLLTWSPVRHVDDASPPVALSMEDVTAPLKKWIRILALHAPESCVVLVGTHSSCATVKPFVEIQDMVRRIVCDEAAVMVRHARREAKQLHVMLESTLAQLVWVVQAMLPGLIGRSIGGTLLTIGHGVFAYHVLLMFRGAKARQGLPPFHEVAPIVTRRDKATFVPGGAA
jgi:hypothetical protein